MKKLILFALLGIGCVQKAQSNVVSSNPGVTVQKLFTTDSCTIYRFEDNGWHYYAVCEGCTPTSVSSQEKRGKSSVEVETPTVCTCKEAR